MYRKPYFGPPPAALKTFHSNKVLQTRETARGLIVNMPDDVLFDTGKYTLKPGARGATQEKLIYYLACIDQGIGTHPPLRQEKPKQGVALLADVSKPSPIAAGFL